MSAAEPNAPSVPATNGAPRGRLIPAIVMGIVAVYLLSVVGRMNPPRQPFDLESAARLPVVDGGRVKPLETVARVYLRMISQREYFVDDQGKSQPAIKWYMDVLSSGGREIRGPAWKHKVFRIENDQLLAELKLKPREGLRYSLEEFASQVPMIVMKAESVQRRKEAKQPIELYDEKVAELFKRLKFFFSLAENYEPLVVPPQEAGEEWSSLGSLRMEIQRSALLAGVKALRSMVSTPEREPVVLDRVVAAMRERDNDLRPKKEPVADDASERLEPLLRILAGGGNPPTDAGVIRERLQALFREPIDKMSGEDLQERFVAFSGLLTKEESRAATGALLAGEQKRLQDRPAVESWLKMIDAYRDNKAAEFNAILAEYRDKELQHVSPHDIRKVRGEAYYNRFAPFYQCTALYVLVFLLCAFSWMGRTEPLRKAAFYTLYLTLIIHTGALVSRMYFQDRWSVFVTNLYSSAVFIGWGCVVLGLILEKLYPIGIGNLVAAVLGVGTTIISHNLGAGGDTLEMMQAVLDTNFWLATHVTTVTFGYTATFVAGFIGVAFVARLLATVIRNSFLKPGRAAPIDLLMFGSAAAGLVAIPIMMLSIALRSAADFEVIPGFLADILTFLAVSAGVVYAGALLFVRASTDNLDSHGTPIPGQLPSLAKVMSNVALDADASKKLTQMIYGVLCFATLLSFVGTVLGGIWADQSWGRFWGWDPKENGAVLIVLWNALILHARWCGLVRDRGIAVLAIAGNMVTAWSWFGTNQLGIGLHAYGFDDRLAKGCTWFWASQFAILLLGLIPRSYWSLPAGLPSATTPDGTAPNGNKPAVESHSNGQPTKTSRRTRPGKKR